nr:NUDIX domain-containing protein [Kribbella solani]
MPRKTAAGGALIRDGGGRILFLEPTYKPTLDIPGGIVEENESPYEACRREVKEEIGLELEIGPLLVVDWIPAAGPWPDALAFIFDGGTLDPETHTDPTHTDLTHTDPTRADLTHTDPTRADLTHTDPTRADLTHTDPTRADLTHTDPTRADLTHTDPTRADLTHTDPTRLTRTDPRAPHHVLSLDPAEVRACHFLTLAEATPRLRPSMARRLALAERALTTGIPVYADFGRP